MRTIVETEAVRGAPGREAEEVPPGPRLLDAEAVEHVLVAAPVAAHADAEVEVDLALELAFERAPGGGADLADLGAAAADQDPLLRFRLRPDLGGDGDEAVRLAWLAHLEHRDLDRVRDLLAGPVQDLLADQLGEQQLRGLVGGVLGRIHVGALGDQLAEAMEQLLEAGALAGADREDLVDSGQVG